MLSYLLTRRDSSIVHFDYSSRKFDYFAKEADMQYSSNSNNPSVARFFNNYLNCLKKTNVKPSLHRWYIKHLERYIKQQNGVKIKLSPPDTINKYLDGIGRQNAIKS